MTPLRTLARDEGAGLRFAGYAALFDVADGARDVIRPGAFRRSLGMRSAGGTGPLPLFWQHRPDQRIGWIEHASEDLRGLRVIASIDNPAGRAAAVLQSGAVDGLSFGFRARSARTGTGGRELIELDLFEISLVTHPLQPNARVHFVDPPAAQASAAVASPIRPPSDTTNIL